MKRILVLDGDDEVRRQASQILEASGFQVTCVADAAHAFEALVTAAPPYELALLDMDLPDDAALAFCVKLREDTRPIRATPVVLMGDAADHIGDRTATPLGALDAITKPFDAEALLAVVESATRRIAAGHASPAPPVVDLRPSAPPVPPWAGRDDDPTLVLAGDLAVLPIGAILQLLQVENQTGVLAITRGSSEITATLRNGLIDLVQSRGAGDEFRLGRFFVETGQVSPAEIDDLLRPGPADDTRPLGDRLLAAGKIAREDLRHALARQSSELVYEVLRWHKGWFAFRRQPAPPLAANAGLGLPVARVMMEGVRRVDEWRVMEAKLGRFDDVLYQDAAGLEALGADLPRAERRVLDAVDGRRTIREVISATHMSSYDACRVLYQFLEARLLRRRTA